MNPATGPDGSPEEDALVLWELVQTAHLADREFRALFATEGLTSTQFGVLACLADGDDFTKAELARALMVRPQSMDPLIEALLAAGLVERDGPARRGRAAGIGITAAGVEKLARVRPAVGELNRPDRLGVEPDQVPLLVAQLRAIRARLGG
ncbi:MarR family winged helix-turn-helix transcriptional regulator [Umezawaea sp.]|uniref:MarR family winged helix-turn-helix transcriptional regulator n=1 Tax=Umezawaea sp. TaxID=1955258 RepID=UPI002ED37683